MCYLIVRAIAFILFTILFRFQAFGRENVPSTGGFILAGNHRSYLDPPALAVACPRVVSFLAKKELFAIVGFGRFISWLNAFPLKMRFGDFRALRWAVKRLKQGQVVVVFPEGERVADGEIVEPMQGVGFLAVQARVPIVPAYISGSNQALPMESKFIRLKKVKVYFGQPISAADVGQGLSRDNLYQVLTARTMQQIRHLQQLAA